MCSIFGAGENIIIPSLQSRRTGTAIYGGFGRKILIVFFRV